MVLQRVIEVNPAADARVYVFVATYLPLRHFWHIPAFLSMSNRVQAQLKATPGVVRYSVRAELLKKRFWTLSVWTGRRDVANFTEGEPHATAERRFPDWAGEGAAFAEWTSTDSRIDWAQALKRLEKPSFYYKVSNE